MKNRKGITLLEMIMVVVIVGIAASLTYPKLQKSIDNRRAKAALDTLREISHAARSYRLSHNYTNPANLNTLETTTIPGQMSSRSFYLNPREYAPDYNYNIIPNDPLQFMAVSNSGRTILLMQCGSANEARDGVVSDTGGFLSAPADCT